MSEYTEKVDNFLAELGVKVTITPSRIQGCPNWGSGCEPFRLSNKRAFKVADHNHGHKYAMTLERNGKTLALDGFWNSINSRWSIKHDNYIESSLNASKPSAYDMLSSYSFSFFTNLSSFEEWCDELGYDTDSMKANKIYQECCADAVKFQRMFSREELERLAELAA